MHMPESKWNADLVRDTSKIRFPPRLPLGAAMPEIEVLHIGDDAPREEVEAAPQTEPSET
ncbi:MAG: hypothetical protein A2849_02075 [Candidatus Taylorbacteria bacterium RIFCSPHIGHO2_01_FULL_51_15]|uniref:Uncharacterized protein n=1 Tax=Candidatus Taylorbacteria bacterium RIFCSPHIGHO2_01_FULL_51_15 TaxID=1802304 RepID=A0A1G2MB16_9BACT|nr:MAG: hypothetical protein A2849_02075 [Candidatus Taylorbacteria bacterium RIFCSPHIGHO2_01_FULL_51_15]